MTDIYEIRPRKDKRGVDLISDRLPFGSLWYENVEDAADFASHQSRSHETEISFYDSTGKLIERRRLDPRLIRDGI